MLISKAYVNVENLTSDYTGVGLSDIQSFSCDTTLNPISIVISSKDVQSGSLDTHRIISVVDKFGTSQTHNIVITLANGGSINGGPFLILNTAYSSAIIYFDGSNGVAEISQPNGSPIEDQNLGRGFIDGGIWDNNELAPLTTVDVDYVICRSNDNIKNIEVQPDTLDMTNPLHWESGVVPSLTVGKITPRLYSNSQDGYVVTYSSIYSTSYDGWKAFSRTALALTDAWITTNGQLTGWLQIQLPIAKVVKRYSVQCNSTYVNSAPQDWTLQGSNTGTFTGEETILDTVTGEVTWYVGQKREFEVAIPEEFLYYRIDCSLNNGHSYVSIGELQLIEKENTKGVWAVYDVTPYYTFDDEVGSNILSHKRLVGVVPTNTDGEIYQLAKSAENGKEHRMVFSEQIYEQYYSSSLPFTIVIPIPQNIGIEAEIAIKANATSAADQYYNFEPTYVPLRQLQTNNAFINQNDLRVISYGAGVTRNWYLDNGEFHFKGNWNLNGGILFSYSVKSITFTR